MAAWLRCLRVGEIFVRDPESGEIAEVLLRKADSAYHARRALWSFVRFPDVLLRDPYLGYPDGAVVPLPPLYDALLALGARLFASSQQGFEVAAAFAAPAFGAATVPLVFALGRRVGGRRTALLAAWLFAVLPASILQSSVGDLDHHAAVAFLGAAYLLLLVQRFAGEVDGGMRSGSVLLVLRMAVEIFLDTARKVHMPRKKASAIFSIKMALTKRPM